ncbi:MAG: leucyl aminopeptidase [Sphingomonas sp.]|nr:leucyl aminopeptidase [Sphingomonas sp.]
MKIEFADARPTGDYALVLPSADGNRPGAASLSDLDKIEATLRRQRFEGEAGSAAEAFTDDGGTARRVLFVGIGSNSAGEAAEKLGGTAVSRLLKSGEKHAVIDVTGMGFDADAAARIALAASLRSWRYDRYHTKTKDKQKPTLETVTIVGGGADADERWTSRWQAVSLGVAFARTLVTEPPNIVYPESFVDLCRPLSELGIEIEVLDGAQMTELGMGALLGVAQGSVRDPRMLVMHWNGGADGGAPTAFVGKGVTFDTGGISIKPAQGMEAMKWDMAGAGGVAGAMLALASRKAKANVIGICGLVENMPSGTAQRPSDVVTSMSGQTVEVINTDAEGRLVLADAITFVQRTYKPATIVDFATLTGAILISLGHEFAGLFTPDDELADRLMAAAATSGDKLWRMPLGESFDRLIDSPIADMKNVGPREGGSITAAQFIKRFVDDGVKWAHVDMAGKAWSEKPSDTYDKGATGFGVRLIDSFVADHLER